LDNDRKKDPPISLVLPTLPLDVHGNGRMEILPTSRHTDAGKAGVHGDRKWQMDNVYGCGATRQKV
jgi:hypothetical protein